MRSGDHFQDEEDVTAMYVGDRMTDYNERSTLLLFCWLLKFSTLVALSLMLEGLHLQRVDVVKGSVVCGVLASSTVLTCRAANVRLLTLAVPTDALHLTFWKALMVIAWMIVMYGVIAMFVFGMLI